MESAAEISKLCESWWERLSDSTKDDHTKYAEQFLALLGWSGISPIQATAKEHALSSVSFILRGGAQSSVAVHFLMPGTLEPPSSLVERGLDFCESTRLLVNGTRKSNIPYAFITDLYRSYLYDSYTDELLLHGDTPEAFSQDIAPVLDHAAVERGALEEMRRQPRSYAARQLRQWCQHWSSNIDSEVSGGNRLGDRAIDRVLVLRYLFEHDILKRTGWRLRKRFSTLISQAFDSHPHACGKALTSLFHDISFDWQAELFAPHIELDRVLSNDAIAVPLLKELALLSRAKFGIATILESFNYGEAAEKARVRLVPESDEERDVYLGKQTLETVDEARISVDILEEGYRAIFYWFDRMVSLYERLDVEFQSKTYTQTPAARSMDLFEWSQMDAERPQALKDKFQHAIERGLRVLYSSPRQYRTARLILYLHIISSYERTRQRFVGFPKVEAALHKRPRLSELEKRWINQPQNEPDTDEDWDTR